MFPPTPRLLLKNARLATLDPAMDGLGIVEDGAVAIDGERIAYAGPEAQSPAEWQAADSIDCEGRWITPGLIDCHTHLVHAGERSQEFEMRLAGADYRDIARAGGGILSTVRAVRAASPGQLLEESLPRLDALISEGVTTVEVKSGYGLDPANEIKCLRVARRLGELRDVSIATTFLGAHAVPPGLKGNAAEHLTSMVEEALPGIVAEGLADAVDGFCEAIAFSPDEIRRFFAAAKRHGLPVKLHADQLSNLHGAKLAADYAALSADHLEHTDEEGARAMAQAGTVAVLLPGAFYFLRETQLPPIELFRRFNTPMAIATDNNPGTSPLTSLLLAMNMAATLFRMTVPECLAGVTREAARALGKLADRGTLEAGKFADLAIWDVGGPAELVYRMGFNPLHRRIYRGRFTPQLTQVS